MAKYEPEPEPTQKYFVGNFVRHKKDNWIGIIHASNINYGGQEYVYCIARFDEPVDCFTARMYFESEVDELFDIIPYPWQLFFKVGDKVKEPGAEKIGTVDHIAQRKEIESGFRPIYVIYPGHSRHYFYNPHELIKIGE